MEPWYKVVTPRKEVREGRSFNPDEFAIALEQVVAGTAPEDYANPVEFFKRTCWTKALKAHTAMVLRRMAGRTEDAPPVLSLLTQFGGGKTHTLTALYHLINSSSKAIDYPGVREVLQEAGLSEMPQGRVAVFVGNAWDPEEGCETPWIDVARQLAGDKGVALLGKAAKTTPPGTLALTRLFAAAGGSVLILFDEVLNFINRYRHMADSFYAFLQNLTVAMTGVTHSAAVISLPRSQVEMTEWDFQWQDRVTKVVHRVAKNLIVLDEAEIAQVVRRRLFEDPGKGQVRKQVAKVYADWCFERRAQLPPEWTAVDTAITEKSARDLLQSLFEACYPFHPATLSVFQRKWQALPHYQQTRGTLAMLAQWVSWAYREGFKTARREPLITLGSAPLEVLEFRSVVLGQLGEPRLGVAIKTDIAGDKSHARALDVDTKGPLKDIHRRVGTVIFFESSGAQTEKVAHLPEIRFAVGEPGIDTTSIDNAAYALESRAFYIRKVGTDGFQIHYKARPKKVASDRRASLDKKEVKKAARKLVEEEFRRSATVPIVLFPEESVDIEDRAKLTIVVMDPDMEWGDAELKKKVVHWTKNRGGSPRLYPASLIWCLKKPGHELQKKVEWWLAWRQVNKEIEEGTLGSDFDPKEKAEVRIELKDAEGEARDEVWASYRYVLLSDPKEKGGLKVIDLGAGHASASESLCSRIITALRSEALLNESIGAGYLDRHWPPSLKEEGIWPLSGLRQSFLDGSLTRLIDPDTVLRRKITEFVQKGEFGLASGRKADGSFERVWFEEPIGPEEVSFEPDVFLLKKEKAKALRTKTEEAISTSPTSSVAPSGEEAITPKTEKVTSETVKLRISGNIPPEVWNRLGTRLLPKLRSGKEVDVGIELSAVFDAQIAKNLIYDLQLAIEDLGLKDLIKVEMKQSES